MLILNTLYNYLNLSISYYLVSFRLKGEQNHLLLEN